MPSQPTQRRLWSLAPYVAGAGLLALMLALSTQFGYSWDERFQQSYGDQIWLYFQGGVPVSSFETAFGMQYLYSGLIEVAAVAAQRLSGADTYMVRHAVDAFFGWVGIVWCGMLAARLAGARAGWLAAALLVLSPRYFGDAMNNSKDVPFAACILIALYYVLTIDDRPPFITWRHAAKLTAAIALAVNVRPIGLVLIPYAAAVFAMVAAHAWLTSPVALPWKKVLAGAGALVLAALVAVPAGTLFWPWAQVQPFTRPLTAFFALTSGAEWTAGYPVLYAGQDLSAGTLPWHYLPVWLAISTPPVVLAGLLLMPLLWRVAVSRLRLAALAVFAIAPIAAAMIRRPNMYDGMRQMLFLVPPLFVLSAAAWVAAVDLTRGWRRTAVVAFLVIGSAEPLIFQLRNHPNQIVYFSPIVGGPRAAFGKFEMDYWANSMLQAVQWSRDLAEQTGMPIVVSGNPWEAVFADSARYRQLAFARRDSLDYHVDIRVLRGPSASVRYFAERQDLLHTVTAADGTPLTVVIPGPAFPQLQQQIERLGRQR